MMDSLSKLRLCKTEIIRLEKLPLRKKESPEEDNSFKNSAAAAAMRSLDEKTA